MLTGAVECLKNLHFNGLLLTKEYNVWSKKVQRDYIHDASEGEIWRKSDLWFGKWHEEFGKLSPEHTKVSKLGLLLGPFIQSRKCMSLNLQGCYVL